MFFIALTIVLHAYVTLVDAEVIYEDCVHRGPPVQVRIAIRESGALTISWKTFGILKITVNDGVVHAEVINDMEDPGVEYSTDETFSNSTWTDSGSSTRYKKLIEASWFHNCRVKVSPSTKYYYRIVGSVPCVAQSDTYHFTSPPSSDSFKPINITIFGDIGSDNSANNRSATQTIEALAEAASNTDFFLHVGDISYADDPELPPFLFYESSWNKFQEKMQIISANKIYMTAAGNHEVTCNQEGDDLCDNVLGQEYRNFSAYLNRFRMPGNESGGYLNMWYSFDFGPAHVVVINTETDFLGAPAGPHTRLNGGNFAADGKQREWLTNDLTIANLNRKNVPWIIVAGHRPFYGSAPNYSYPLPHRHDDNCDPCRPVFGELLFDQKVDFYFCGHVHWYERLFPVNRMGMPLADNYTNPAGPIHITTGAGGAPEGANIFNSTGVAPASAYMKSIYGYSTLEIISPTYCRLRFYDSFTKEVVDSVDIIHTS